MIKILGIDPGSTRAGYGLIEKNGHDLKLIKSGLLKISSKDKNVRLLELSKSFSSLLKKTKPDYVAIEKIFFMKNIKTGIEVAQARGVLIMTAASRKIPTMELAPSEVKLNITGLGNADKKLVADMVFKILKIPKRKMLDDETDAIAIAIAASNQIKWLSTIDPAPFADINSYRSRQIKSKKNFFNKRG